MKISLIIAAGGNSKRFSDSLIKKSSYKGAKREDAPFSKLFVPIANQPLLMHTLHAFQDYPQIQEIILAVPSQAIPMVRRSVSGFKKKKLKVISGGKTRAESVWKALKQSSEKNPWVMVHDGARPFVSREAVERLFKVSQKTDGVILAKKVIPTIKQVSESGEILRTLDRTSLYEAETPQLVRRKILKKAYQEIKDAFLATDEASLLEKNGNQVKVVAHSAWNPKVTTIHDLELVQARWHQEKSESVKFGFGRDLHRLVEKRKLYLGGLLVPSEKGALGHSDGDVVLHAVIDAILGVMGAGDIGEWFSDQNPKHKNIQSSKMLKEVKTFMDKEGWQIEHLDTVVFLERPKLGSQKEKIRKNIAKLLHLEIENVSVKAKTMEGLGPIGNANALSCEALVTMKKRSL